MIPYALSAQLSAAAQMHANDIARTGRPGHNGSDGSTVFTRVAQSGYGAYSWGRRLGENWAHYRSVAAAVQMWMNSVPHRNNILHPMYREFGVGLAETKEGSTIYVAVFGAQPNVLPVFIDNGARETASRQVILTLSNEDYALNGEGAQTIGQAKEIQISNSPTFDAQWQPFRTRVDWTLPPAGGSKTVYVKFRDARGRTVTSQSSIHLKVPLPTNTPSRTNTPRPRATTIRSPVPVPTSSPEKVPSDQDESACVGFAARLDECEHPSASANVLDEATVPIPTVTLVGSALDDYDSTPTMVSDSSDNPDSAGGLPINALALGIFGLSVMLGVFSAIRYFTQRSNHE